MSQVYDRIHDRLRHLRSERRELRLADFADLGLEGETVHRYLKDLEAERIVAESFRPRFVSKEGTRVIADIFFRITDEGREELGSEAESSI